MLPEGHVLGGPLQDGWHGAVRGAGRCELSGPMPVCARLQALLLLAGWGVHAHLRGWRSGCCQKWANP